MTYENLKSTVGQLVTERPSRRELFEKLGIDYCCGGQKTLEAACMEKNLAPEDMRRMIQEFDSERYWENNEEDRNWSEASLSELVDHILSTHHIYLEEEFPELTQLIDKVVQAHGDNHQELIELKAAFIQFREEMYMHMDKEEQVLFPYIKQLSSSSTLPEMHCGTIRQPITVMLQEHDDAKHQLERFRELTNGYIAPEDVCNSYRVMLDRFIHMEQDIHMHIHKENNILFPKAVEVFDSLAVSSCSSSRLS